MTQSKYEFIGGTKVQFESGEGTWLEIVGIETLPDLDVPQDLEDDTNINDKQTQYTEPFPDSDDYSPEIKLVKKQSVDDPFFNEYTAQQAFFSKVKLDGEIKMRHVLSDEVSTLEFTVLFVPRVQRTGGGAKDRRKALVKGKVISEVTEGTAT